MGPLASRFVWRSLKDQFTTDGVVNYGQLLLIPSLTAVAAAVLLVLFFHPPKTAAAAEPATA
jgi:hypothetical protein